MPVPSAALKAGEQKAQDWSGADIPKWHGGKNKTNWSFLEKHSGSLQDCNIYNMAQQVVGTSGTLYNKPKFACIEESFTYQP